MATNEKATISELKEREKCYWRNFENKHPDECLSLVAKQFLGCSSEGKALDRPGLSNHVSRPEGDFDEGKSTVNSPKVDFEAIVDGDTAIILFRQGERLVTHTWVRRNGNWLLMGGMSQGR